ncbi:MAG: UDP-N-acetylmuramate dehydrogenase [Chloroflexi bacterium]|nr:UDP-N-acetylmuramate dehydrogenase [Chloroflexota bacterium]
MRRDLIEKGYGERLLTNEPLARHTSFAIGGPSDLFISVRTKAEFVEVAQMAWGRNVPVLLLGGGTNVLVADAGLRGITIVNECRGYRLGEDGLLLAESGVWLAEVARWTVQQGWAGLEWAVGIPGTLGGAVVGNAGAYGGCMADVVRRVTLLQPNRDPEEMDAEQLDYSYRMSALKQENWRARRRIVLEAAIQLTPGDPEELARKTENVSTQRRLRTPVGCCAGSIFKRTMQYPAGFLIEQAGLKGRRIGGAEVSPKHANFLMNTGGATAADVKALIDLVQKTVWASFAQRLEPEIELVGEWA